MAGRLTAGSKSSRELLYRVSIRVKTCGLLSLKHFVELGDDAGLFLVLLLVAAAAGVPVPEDEVQLVVRAAFVGPKHDGVVGLVVKPTLVPVLLDVGKELHVGATAALALLELRLRTAARRARAQMLGLVQLGGDGMVACHGLEHRSQASTQADLGSSLHLPLAIVLGHAVFCAVLGGFPQDPSFFERM